MRPGNGKSMRCLNVGQSRGSGSSDPNRFFRVRWQQSSHVNAKVSSAAPPMMRRLANCSVA